MGLVSQNIQSIFWCFSGTRGLKNNFKKLVIGAIRLPIIFLRLNTMMKGKKQRKVAFIMKLAISNFRCPGETYITDFTRLPQLKDDMLLPDVDRARFWGRTECLKTYNC